MRLWGSSSSSPHLAQELAADLLLPRIPVAHEAARSAEDRDPEPGKHARDAIVSDVDAAARPRYAANAVDRARAIASALEDDGELLRAVAFGLSHVGNEPFA